MAKLDGGATDRHKLNCADGYPISISHYSASRARGVVVIASAVGIPQRFYEHFASFLREQQFHVITFCYRGTGTSLSKNDPFDINLEDWGRQDIDAVIEFSKRLCSVDNEVLPIHYMGHSIGGQLVGFAPNSISLSSIVWVAASAPYWQRWKFPTNLQMLFVSRIAIPLISLTGKEFPSKTLGLGAMKFPSSASKQWAEWMTKPNYLFDDKFKLETDRYAQLDLPLLAFGFDDDAMAPEVNIESLLEHFPNTRITRKYIDHEKLGLGLIGHAGFFREKFESTLWQDTVDWFDAISVDSKMQIAG